ncbi:Laccase [Thalictrum thalictroides]|uniref:laccase n=1 Tax=Thalictrum thalictroides TaxID=46969 RepID=A0A7J6VF30_THATH|nr:Laccase [Thalictrum thalictroides]
MERMISLLAFVLILLASTASAATVEHTFNVASNTLQRLCRQEVKTLVNGSLPGPVIKLRDGDELIVHVNNKHGVFQMFSGWADGPAYVTQCPIVPGRSFTYRFNITGQEGEWWDANVVDVEHELTTSGGIPRLSDAFTINGQPGDIFPCSSNETYTMDVRQGKTYLLRMVNAVMMNHLFFKIAQHKFTVVAVDARYIEPYETDVVVIAPGQSADVLFTANQPIGNYYMAARAYFPTPIEFQNGTTTGIVHYVGVPESLTPLMPILPDFNDTETSYKFYSNLTSLTTIRNPHWHPVPKNVDEKMFITFGIGFQPCNGTCSGPQGSFLRFAANMNNISFVLPTKMSMLEAFHGGVQGIYTEDFPDNPPMVFNYTDPNISLDFSLLVTQRKETRVKRLKYNSVVEIVLQSTSLVAAENHPLHFHGFDFYVLAQGFGNYDPINDPNKFNLVNPQQRNTIGVPINGWAVIRFIANNPGVWFVHCHREAHLTWGLNMAFVVENGPTPSTSLPPPPSDLPTC